MSQLRIVQPDTTPTPDCYQSCENCTCCVAAYARSHTHTHTPVNINHVRSLPKRAAFSAPVCRKSNSLLQSRPAWPPLDKFWMSDAGPTVTRRPAAAAKHFPACLMNPFGKVFQICTTKLQLRSTAAAVAVTTRAEGGRPSRLAGGGSVKMRFLIPRAALKHAEKFRL